MARERLGWGLPEVAASLRIRLGYLVALEAGRPADFPAAAYALGFLRAYATALGLDPEDQVRRFKASAADVRRRTELDFPVPVPERGLPAGAVLLMAAVLAVGVYAGWYRLSGEGRLPAEVVQPVPMRLAPLAEQAIPLPPPPVAPAPEMMASKPAEPPPPDYPWVPPGSAAAAMPLPAPSVPAVAPTPADPNDTRIVIRAKADSWVQVRDHAGPVLLNRILRAGETWPVPQKANLLLTTGNAGGTDLLVDGVAAPAIGGNGMVRRDLPLDADTIREGKLPAQLQASGTQPSAGRGTLPQ